MNPCINKSFLIRSFFVIITILLLQVIKAGAQDIMTSDTLSKVFYDSLKVKAERRKITSLLYDMIITSPNLQGTARDKMSSTSLFDEYAGKIIRNKEIIRLNAFGSDINNPSENNPSKTEKLLNSSYTKSKQFIINRYLLFTVGDTVVPLQMADNERLIRQLPFIDDAHIAIIPVDSNMVDIAVIVRENYPYGMDMRLHGISSGSIRVFDKNFAGVGHELALTFPYNFKEYPYPGFGVKYYASNIVKTFSNLELDFADSLGINRLSGRYSRGFVSSETKFAWSAYINMTSTTEDLDTMPVPSPLRFTIQDYWLARSVMLDRNTVTRLIFSARYIHNNVFRRPEINDYSYYRLQNYQLSMLGIALSSQRFINTSLIYSYGRTEDIPYGYMIELTGGRENNEFKWRTYAGMKLSYGNIFTRIGYIYTGIGISTFYNRGYTEQGMVYGDLRYFTPLVRVGRSMVRTFVNAYYMRGFDRYSDETLYLNSDNLIRGFRNDSINGNTRLAFSVEPVLFINKSVVGFRFALFAFADTGILVKGSLSDGKYYTIPALGVGIRIRNDQLVLNTLQIRLAWYPNSPPWSEESWITANGISRLKPKGFEPTAPGIIPYQ